MLIVAPVAARRRVSVPAGSERLEGIEKLQLPRSEIPAVTHVDLSARIQTVREETHPELAAVLREFHRLTGCSVLVNTSFNVRGEPIVCTPEDSYRCFMRTEIDALALETRLLLKADQPAFAEQGDWQRDFALD